MHCQAVWLIFSCCEQFNIGINGHTKILHSTILGIIYGKQIQAKGYQKLQCPFWTLSWMKPWLCSPDVNLLRAWCSVDISSDLMFWEPQLDSYTLVVNWICLNSTLSVSYSKFAEPEFCTSWTSFLEMHIGLPVFWVPPLLLQNLEKWFFFLHLRHSFLYAGHCLRGWVWPQLPHLFWFLSWLWDLPWLDLEQFCLLWPWECLVTLYTSFVVFPSLPTFWSNCFNKFSVRMMDSTILISCRISTKASVIFIFSINWSLNLSLVLWIRNVNLTISSLFSKLQPFATSCNLDTNSFWSLQWLP